jgi:hypothetical protein
MGISPEYWLERAATARKAAAVLGPRDAKAVLAYAAQCERIAARLSDPAMAAGRTIAAGRAVTPAETSL